MSSAPSLSPNPDPNLLSQLRKKDAAPLRLLKGRPILFADQATHRSAWDEDAELYALSAIASGVSLAQRSRALFVILGASWAALSPVARATVSRVTRLLLVALPSEDVLTVMLSLRRARANHKHTARAIVRYLTEHPQAEELARSRPRAVRDVLEHAVGRNTVRGIASNKNKNANAAAACGSISKTLPHARDVIRTNALLALLYRKEPWPLAPIASTATDAHAPYASALEGARETPKTINATNRGDVSATLVHMYRGGTTNELERWLERFVATAAARLSAYDGTIALVLDASASMRGYGEREYCAIAQSVALSLVLARACPKLRVFNVGGNAGDAAVGAPPHPEGATDLASALIEAAQCKPDVIAIVTDGYENLEDGDLAAVARALPGAGVQASVVVCQSKFTFKDDLALRRPAPFLEEVGFWHEDDFQEVLLTLASRSTNPTMASTYLRRTLAARLEGLEKEVEPWISAP